MLVATREQLARANEKLANANRKLVAVAVGMTLLMGLVACVAYLAGRSVTMIRARQSETPSPRVIEPRATIPVANTDVATPLPKAMFVPKVDGSAQLQAFAPLAKSEAAPPPPTVVSVPKLEAAPPPRPIAPMSKPGSSERYFQVGLISPAQEPAFTHKLKALGYPFRVVSAPGAVRILIGPVAGPAERAEMSRRLTADGYQHFLRPLQSNP